MKWKHGAIEGSVVAGGQGQGNSLTQLSFPYGLFVDHHGNIYVTDSSNLRVIRRSQASGEVSIVAGGNGAGNEPNQLTHPFDISFDRKGNLYVADYFNQRIQKFHVDSN